MVVALNERYTNGQTSNGKEKNKHVSFYISINELGGLVRK